MNNTKRDIQLLYAFLAATIVLFTIVLCLILTSCNPSRPVSPLPTPQAVSQKVSPLSVPTPPGSAIIPTPAPNLITNPGLEGEYHIQDNIPEVTVPDGWRAWYLDVPPCRPLTPGCELPCPDNCLKTSAPQSVLEVIDPVLYTYPPTVPLALETGTVVTFSARFTMPVSAIELYVFHNQAIISVTNRRAHLGQIWGNTSYTRLEWSIDGQGKVGNVELFSLEFTPISTGTYPFEIVVFYGGEDGGWSGDGWYPGIAPTNRVTASVSIRKSQKCSPDNGCYWVRPEFVPILASQFDYRVLEGERAQKYFGWLRMYQGGIYQTVTGLTPGQYYRFGAHVQAWHCFDPDDCCSGRCSDLPDLHRWRVGIDPFGGDDPLSPDIVWSDRHESFDAYREIAIVARSQSPTITVWVEAAPHLAFAKMVDSYVDALTLYSLNGYTEVYLPFVITSDN